VAIVRRRFRGRIQTFTTPPIDPDGWDQQ